jgi:hypothetical protein
MYTVPYSSESVLYVNNFFNSIYKYLPKYICRIISTIKKTNIGGTQLPDKAPPPMRLCTSIGLLSMEPEQLLEMTELVPRHVFHAEVFRIHTGGATLGGWQSRGSVCSYIADCLRNHGVHYWRGHTVVVCSSLEDRGHLLISVLAIFS